MNNRDNRSSIRMLDSDTVSRIAAGEVVERPVNIVKELLENAIDAGSSAVTCEIRDGGLSYIRVTDNGCGIPKEEVRLAFQRHATSKIRSAEDLHDLHSLGFRGEALASIAAVARVEMITKTADSLTAVRATNSPLLFSDAQESEEDGLILEEIGAPDGTSVVVRDLFYNMPVRKKFMKSPQTEGGVVTDLVQQMALSHPDISFTYRMNGQDKFHTSGSGNLKDILYRLYGKDTASSLIEVSVPENEAGFSVYGYVGHPQTTFANRRSELFFVNGRILESPVLTGALEAGYGTDLMQHRFPFGILFLNMPASLLDVNVHPAKKEVRFSDPETVYAFIRSSVQDALARREMIHREHFLTGSEERILRREEDRTRQKDLREEVRGEIFETGKKTGQMPEPQIKRYDGDGFLFEDHTVPESPAPALPEEEHDAAPGGKTGYQDLVIPEGQPGGEVREPRLFTEENARSFRLIGQVFKTYWLIESGRELILVDQHAAHEKVNFERIMKQLSDASGAPVPSQLLFPPILVNLTGAEESILLPNLESFEKIGYRIEPMGGSSYALRAVPLALFGADPEALLKDTLADLAEEKKNAVPGVLVSRIATMSCKAAVKGNRPLSEEEARALIDELLSLDNPYHCPHGRPTMITFSQYELDRKFKRIV